MDLTVFNDILMCPNCSNSLNFETLENKVYIKCKSCSKEIIGNKNVFNFINKNEEDFTSDAYDDVWEDICKNNAKSNTYKLEREVVKKYSNLIKSKIILDAGVGDGRHLEIIAKEKPKGIICVDISDGIELAQKRWRRLELNIPIIFIKCDLDLLQISKHKVDFIWCTGVITIAKNPSKIINKLGRISKETVLIGLLSNNIYGKIYYNFNYLRPLFRRLKRNKLLKIITYSISILIMLLTFIKNLFVDQKRFTNKENILISIKRINSLIQEPFISPNVNKIDKKNVIKRFSSLDFKYTSAGQEKFLNYLIFRKTSSLR